MTSEPYMMERQTYVHIFIHVDVYNDALDIVNALSELLGYEAEGLATLRDALEPRSEVDVFGYMPNVRRSHLLPKTAPEEA